MMEELLKKINDTFDACMTNSTEETQLQLRIIKNNINAIIHEHMEQANDNQGGALSLNDNKKTIMIIDDSPIVRNYLEKILSDEYNVILALDGQDAINTLNVSDIYQKLNLIILDLMMPNIDGFGVLEYLNGKKEKCPVMIISGDNSKETINKAFQYNVVDIIEKPFDTKKIKEKIAQYVEH